MSLKPESVKALERFRAPGRPHAEGEILSKQRVLAFAQSMYDRAMDAAAAEGVSFPAYVRRALAAQLDPAPAPDPAMVGTNSFRAPFLTKAPAGPWTEAVRHAGHLTLSADVADEMDAHDDDVLVRAVGESLEGRGLPDGSLLLMYPLPHSRTPRPGQVALVQIVTEEGEYESTLKVWRGGEPVRLEDGDGEPFELPENVQRVDAVAVARAAIVHL